MMSSWQCGTGTLNLALCAMPILSSITLPVSAQFVQLLDSPEMQELYTFADMIHPRDVLVKQILTPRPNQAKVDICIRYDTKNTLNF